MRLIKLTTVHFSAYILTLAIMSVSPPLRRLSETSSSSKESLINAYEAEEERIINILSRKLEKVPIARTCQTVYGR
jgi:hypothetical protein